MKLIHAGDIHLDPRDPQPALASLHRLEEYVIDHKPVALLLAGDLFDRAVPATDAAGMSELLRVMRNLAEGTVIISITGTPTHDRPGAYAPLYDHVAILSASKLWLYLPGAKLLVTGTPEPRILAGDGDYASAEAAALERTRAQLRVCAKEAADLAEAKHDGVHVHMHHGAIAAVATETGYYTTGAPGELSLTPQDLDIPGARYVALGHIHKQQRVDGCNTEAWYCGSAYPTDWGERDQKGALLVTIPKNAGVSVRPLPYPHRPRRKYSIVMPAGTDMVNALARAPELAARSARGFDIWLQVTHDPQIMPSSQVRNEICFLVNDAVGDKDGDHRIDLRAAPREAMVRADLSEQPSWADQLKTWLEVTDGPPATAEHLRLAESLQAQTAGPAGDQRRAWRIDALHLQGARGLDGGELHLNLRNYPPGLLAIAGPNGAGKTTVLEHMCPWPELLTRGGSLSAAFTGQSRRELAVTDTESGEGHHLRINISAGGIRHHSIDDLLPDGTTRTYTEYVEKLFGDRATYVAGGIQPQKPIMLRLRGPDGSTSNCTSDLIAAPAGMRRHLLRAILGLDAYQHGAVLARELAKDKGRCLDRVGAQLEVLPNSDVGADAAFQAAYNHATDAAEDLASAQERQRDLHASREEVRRAADDTRALQSKIALFTQQAETCDTNVGIARRAADGHRAHAERLPELEALVVKGEAIRREVEAAQAAAERERLVRDAEMEQVRRSRDTVETAARNEHRALLGTWLKKVDACSESAHEITRLEAVIGIEREKAEQGTAEHTRLNMPGPPCSVCGQPLGEDKRAELLAQAEMNRDLHRARLDETNSALYKAASEKRDPGSTPEYLPPDTDEFEKSLEELALPTATENMAELHKREFRAHSSEWLRMTGGNDRALSQAQNAAAAERQQIAAAVYQKTAAGSLRTRVAELEAALDLSTLARETELVTEIARGDVKVNDCTAVHAHANADFRVAKDRLDRETERLETSKRLQETAAKYLQEHTDAKLLADALAPTGIQALLLEQAAPQIATDANAMLADSYGERWQIRLELQKIGRDKIAEDLRIVVTDTESDQQPSDDQLGPGEQLAETLSGGEATWVRQALAGALALARARHTGKRQLTALLDEADGALSEDARVKYFDLLESQHRRLGRHHTIVVTHSQEMLDRLGPERVIRLGIDTEVQ